MKSDKILFLSLAVAFLASFLLIGCGGEKLPPTAVLSAAESSQVPGRIVLDASQSTDSDGEIVEYTFSIEDADGNTVAGPFTTREVPELSIISSIVVAGTYMAHLTVVDSSGLSDSTQVEVSHDSEVVFSSVSSSVSTLVLDGGIKASTIEGDSISCGRYTEETDVTCVLSTASSSVDLIADLLPLAQNINSKLDETAIIWIQAWGARGGSGDSGVFGSAGSSGKGGFAQTITSLRDFKSIFGTSTIHYYLGQIGSHSIGGGQGGTSTMVTTANLESTTTSDIDLETEVILIAGGAGGGGGGSFFNDGHEGKNGGTAIATDSNAAFGAGGNSHTCTGGNVSGDGDGGSKSTDDSTKGNDGIGGKGGGSKNKGANDSWLNGAPQIVNNGGGGTAATVSLAGGGGGGYGGGGGESGDSSHFGGCDGGGSDCPGYGGCGGGSYATISFGEDSDAPSEFVANDDTSNGEVRIVFVFF